MSSQKMSSDVQRPDLSRRTVLTAGLAALATGFLMRVLSPALAHAASAPSPAAGQSAKPLIAFYSRTGNTRAVAEQIRSRTNGELFEVRATHAYPEAYRATTEQARRELDANFRPTLTAQVANMASHNVIFIGYPNWWGTLPMALFTFLESYPFSGKTLVPFCTHEGSGLARGPADIARLCPGATLLDGFAVRGGSAASAQANVDRWLKQIGLA